MALSCTPSHTQHHQWSQDHYHEALWRMPPTNQVRVIHLAYINIRAVCGPRLSGSLLPSLVQPGYGDRGCAPKAPSIGNPRYHAHAHTYNMTAFKSPPDSLCAHLSTHMLYPGTPCNQLQSARKRVPLLLSFTPSTSLPPFPLLPTPVAQRHLNHHPISWCTELLPGMIFPLAVWDPPLSVLAP